MALEQKRLKKRLYEDTGARYHQYVLETLKNEGKTST